MRRKRVTGRFYLFLLILGVIAFLIVRPHISFGTRLALVSEARAPYTQQANAVFIRDEKIFESESMARVEFIAMEGTLVNSGDTVAYLYSAGYTENELKKLFGRDG